MILLSGWKEVLGKKFQTRQAAFPAVHTSDTHGSWGKGARCYLNWCSYKVIIDRHSCEWYQKIVPIGLCPLTFRNSLVRTNWWDHVNFTSWNLVQQVESHCLQIRNNLSLNLLLDLIIFKGELFLKVNFTTKLILIQVDWRTNWVSSFYLEPGW